jgi:cbb3-type cytochrome oxidase subunit 3
VQQQMVGGFETSATAEILKFGLVGVLAAVFALVIAYLYREHRKDRKEWDKERVELSKQLTELKEEQNTEKVALRAEYERKLREETAGIVEQYHKRQTEIRNEFLSSLDKFSTSSQLANQALLQMLQKFYDHLVK